MDEDRKHELSVAINMLLLHNLWRREKIAQMPCLAMELGDAIETVCGAAYEHLADMIEVEHTRKAIKAAEKTLDIKDHEINRLRAILARHKIKYREGNVK